MCQLTKLSFGELSINLSCKTQTTYFQQKSINFIEISSSIFSSRPKAFSPALLPNLHPPQKKKLNDPPICPSHIFCSQPFTSLRVFLTPPLGVENLRLSFSLGGNTAARLQFKEWKCRGLVTGRFQVEGIQCQFSKFSWSTNTFLYIYNIYIYYIYKYSNNLGCRSQMTPKTLHSKVLQMISNAHAMPCHLKGCLPNK